MRVASFVDGATLIFGRNHFPSKPKSVSRSELEFSLTGTNAMVKQVGSNSTYLLADGETRKLATGESASLVDGCIIALDKSRMHKARFVLQPPAEVHALSSDEEVLEPQHVAAEIYALSSDAESPPTKPLEPQRVAAKPLEQQRVSAQHVAPQRVVAQPVAVDVDASDDEVEVVAPRNKGADRREGKRPRRPPPPVADSSVVVDVIDLEAATGVGVGVSGKPLLPGELEARQQRYRKTWTLRATRSTDDTPEEQHYRFAESAWCRGGGMANQISAVEYHFHPTLEARWHSKKAEYDSRFGVGGHTILFAFHGTRPGNVQLILNDGFRVSKVGSTTDAGFFGAGIYFSEHMTHSQGYNSGNDGMFLCKILVGKPFLCPQQNGRGLEPGYTSHVADPSGSEVVIFDDAAMVPDAGGRTQYLDAPAHTATDVTCSILRSSSSPSTGSSSRWRMRHTCIQPTLGPTTHRSRSPMPSRVLAAMASPMASAGVGVGVGVGVGAAPSRHLAARAPCWGACSEGGRQLRTCTAPARGARSKAWHTRGVSATCSASPSPATSRASCSADVAVRDADVGVAAGVALDAARAGLCCLTTTTMTTMTTLSCRML